MKLRILFIGLVSASAVVTACGWDPSRPFERDAPQVKEAITHLGDAGDAATAADLLEEYLTTGVCAEGNIGTPGRLHERPNGSFDLGLALFRVAETFGHRFGEEEVDAGEKGPRAGLVECALRVVRAVAADPSQPVDLRARARYLEGNLLFLNASYDEAVSAYDLALEHAPGMGDAGPIGAPDSSVYLPDPVGRDAAYNRAIALRRIEDKKKDAGNDASPNQDGGGDGGEKGDSGKNDERKDGGGGPPDAGNEKPDAASDSPDAGQNKPPPKPESEDAGAPPPPSRQSQDDRILDQLENAPTVQQEAAKKQARGRKVRGMADK